MNLNGVMGQVHDDGGMTIVKNVTGPSMSQTKVSLSAIQVGMIMQLYRGIDAYTGKRVPSTCVSFGHGLNMEDML